MKVVYSISDNIVSSLGFTTSDNMLALKNDRSGIGFHPGEFNLPEPFSAALVDFKSLNKEFSAYSNVEKYTDFERLLISSVREAAAQTSIDLASPETLFIISTTKGNVSLLDSQSTFGKERVNLWASANEIQHFFKNPNEPIVVSQACISGVSAIILAKMYLESGLYKHVVVTGGDKLSKFIVSGFQSFKALSMNNCKPFDMERDGLSLGEGAATIILGIAGEEELKPNSVAIKSGSTSNDANHISGPSRTGEGLYRAILRTLKDTDPAELGFINAHGTATPYNDEMEAIAISRAGLETLPVNSLKGYFGHTLGAAGLIETIVCSHSLMNSQLIKCKGFSTKGVTTNINVITENIDFKGSGCLKMASGFGGCNAVIQLKRYN